MGTLPSSTKSAALLIERFIESQSPDVLASLLSGQLVLALAKPNPLIAKLNRKSPDDAVSHLSGKTVPELKKFLIGPTINADAHPLASGRQTKANLIDAVFESAFGYVLSQPKSNQESTSRGSTTPKPRVSKAPF